MVSTGSVVSFNRRGQVHPPSRETRQGLLADQVREPLRERCTGEVDLAGRRLVWWSNPNAFERVFSGV